MGVQEEGMGVEEEFVQKKMVSSPIHLRWA